MRALALPLEGELQLSVADAASRQQKQSERQAALTWRRFFGMPIPAVVECGPRLLAKALIAAEPFRSCPAVCLCLPASQRTPEYACVAPFASALLPQVSPL